MLVILASLASLHYKLGFLLDYAHSQVILYPTVPYLKFVFPFSWRWETAMMSMIAGEGTNSGEREVTMIVQEREKTDAEMTGTTGKKRWRTVSPKHD